MISPKKIIQGNIPQKVTYISSGQISVQAQWDDIEDLNTKGTMVTPAFVSDASNETTLETGRTWAQNRLPWDYKSNKQIGHDINEVTFENTPRSGYKIVNLEIRSEGGRAYKIISPDGYYFDLREDVLLDTMLKCGIKEGGELVGEFLWAKVGSQMKLIRHGSLLHDRLVEATERGSAKKIGVSNLQVGGVYRSKGTKQGIFCGFVDTISIELVTKARKLRWNELPELKKVHYVNRAQLWVEVPEYNKKSYQEFFSNFVKEKKYFYIEVKKSSSVVELVDTIQLPANVVKICREMITKDSKPGNNGLENMSYGAERYNMVSSGQPLNIHPAYAKYISGPL